MSDRLIVFFNYCSSYFFNVKGIVLAGGESRRFGENRLLIKIHGMYLISYVIKALDNSSFINEVLISTTDKFRDDYGRLGYKVILDDLMMGPIGAVYLAVREFGDCFIAAGDMPLLKTELVDIIIGKFYREGGVACIPRWSDGFLEPLCGVYSKSIVGKLCEYIENGGRSIQEFLRDLEITYVDIDSLPSHLRKCFFNVNTRDDLERILSDIGL